MMKRLYFASSRVSGAHRHEGTFRASPSRFNLSLYSLPDDGASKRLSLANHNRPAGDNIRDCVFQIAAGDGLAHAGIIDPPAVNDPTMRVQDKSMRRTDGAIATRNRPILIF